MDTNGSALTVTGDTFSGNVSGYDHNYQVGTIEFWPPYVPVPTVYPWWPSTHYYIPYPQKPLHCANDCHVFSCEHATKCKCGKATRKLEPKRCSECGK